MNPDDDLDPAIFADLHSDDPTRRLTADEERDLAVVIEAGVIAESELGATLTEIERRILIARGACARERVMLANLGLVGWVVSEEWRGHDRDDLYQEGVLGLERAIRGYDHRRGAFAAYATPWIRQAVFEGRAHLVGRGVRWYRQWHQLRHLEESLWQREGRSVSTDDLADEMGQSTEWVTARRQWPTPAALATHHDRADAASAEPASIPAERLFELLDGLDRLPRKVLELRFGIGGAPRKGREQVARLVGMTAKQIARIEDQALDDLRGLCPVDWGLYLGA